MSTGINPQTAGRGPPSRACRARFHVGCVAPRLCGCPCHRPKPEPSLMGAILRKPVPVLSGGAEAIPEVGAGGQES